MAKISFVMPNRNKATFLVEAIESLRNQTLDDIEVVIIDDDSADDSQDIIRHYEKKDKRIKSIFLKDLPEVPVAERIDRARNIGNKEATSGIICVMDSDDISLPRRAELTYEYLTKYPQCDIFYGSYYQRNRYGEVDERIPDYLSACEFSKKQLKETGFFFIGHLTVGYRKETIIKYPYNTEAGVGDWGMFYNLLIKHNVKSCFTTEPLCIYRVYNNALKHLHDPKFNEYLLDKKQKKMELMGELKDI
jgi:glycosyltransferase involved in cell wall biosynthesis